MRSRLPPVALVVFQVIVDDQMVAVGHEVS